MLGNILATAGASISKHFGGGILSTIGRWAGRYLGDYLDKELFHNVKTIHKFTNIKDSFYISKAEYGKPIPLIFGRMRLMGQIIWADKIVEQSHTQSISRYFKNTYTTLESQTTELEYFLSFAMALCEGEISDIERVWYGETIIDLSQYKFRLYKGDESQLPDPLISSKSNEPTPGYRGLAYIVFEELPLADFGNIVPNLSFEVTRKTSVKYRSVEDMVESMVMIPGSGEFVYDTEIQEKTVVDPYGGILSKSKINSHNHYNIANSLRSLDQLKMVCENVKWIAPVVCWFANSMDLNICTIKPAIEFKDDNLRYSQQWIVGKYDRTTAHEISKDQHNNPIYGGSVNDESLIRYLIELKKRGLKIMFYPMFFMDVPNKPWRGRLTGNVESVVNFFQKEHGYNDFILHYAHLVKNHVDAFIIGSELIGLTRVTDGRNFPAVDQLINLARQVKAIVGHGVRVSYAADWSEYHHTDAGWFNLDSLWASEYIDFVGIDAYFPVTDSLSSAISPTQIYDGFTGGEGYEYFIDKTTGVNVSLEDKYAWKKLRYWWENRHQNPDGQYSRWQPRLKPIWFTEFGFPSIDKATNQPNVFFDPECIDGGIPKNSNGNTDFLIQRAGIKAFIEYWKAQEFIEQMFLWTWDARPYPAWPHTNIWRDSHLWEKGHWVNSKFGIANLASIIMEISHRCNIDLRSIDVSSIDHPVDGFILNGSMTGMEAINTLRTCYFFDIKSLNLQLLQFVKRGYGKESEVQIKDCLKLFDNSYLESTAIPASATLGKLDLNFIDKDNNYYSCHKHFNNNSISYEAKATIKLPIVVNEYEAEKIGLTIIANAQSEKLIIKFSITSDNFIITPTDFAIINYQSTKYFIRIINIELKAIRLEIIGIVDNKNNYLLPPPLEHTQMQENYNLPSEEIFTILSLPFSPSGINAPFLAIYFQSTKTSPLYAKFSSIANDDWVKIRDITPTNNISYLVQFNQRDNVNIFHIDEESYILVRSVKLEKIYSGRWQHAMIGAELICFKNIDQIESGLYKISFLIRGLLGTEKYMNLHLQEELCIMLDTGINIPVAQELENTELDFKCGNNILSIIYQNQLQKPLVPYIANQILENNILYLSLVMRSKNYDTWHRQEEIEKHNFTIKITARGQTIVIQADQEQIIADLTQLDLSDGYNIDIII